MPYVRPAFLTFTTYGTWLHGDERGSINRKGRTLRAHFVAPNAKLVHVQRMNMIQPPLLLDADMRGCVQSAVEGYCGFKHWQVLALHVRTNHVHALIRAGEAASRVIQGIKAAATRALREQGLVSADRRVWTHGGSATLCENESDIAAVRHYILHGQGAPLPATRPEMAGPGA